MEPSADFLTTLNAIRILPFSWRKRFSLLRAYLLATINRRLRLDHRAEFDLWGLRHLAPSWKTAEFLIKDVYIGTPYRLPLMNAATIFDVGANCGFATLFFKAMYPEAVIVAVEPQARESACITEAIALNRLQDVHVHHCAVGPTSGVAEFITQEDNSVVSSTSEKRTGQGEKLQVKVSKLSSLLPNWPIDILKLDIEGAEVAVLRELADAKALSPQKIRNIVMEYHRFDPAAMAALPGILSLLESSGYEYAFDARTHCGSSHQDVLVYCRQKL